MINSAGDFGPMIFGTGERLLLPFGLHHILVALIRFTEAGGTLDVCGHSVSGALTIFRAQLSCPTTHGFAESATRFLSQGKMPAFLGGLPGAALAMYHCARPENRHKIKGLLISGSSPAWSAAPPSRWSSCSCLSRRSCMSSTRC